MKSKGIWNKVPGILFGLAAVFAFFAVFAEGFASMYNMQNLLKDCSLLIIVSLGMNLAIMSGKINISVGAVMSLCGVITGIQLQRGVNIGIAILIGLLAGLALGLVCGYMIAYQTGWLHTHLWASPRAWPWLLRTETPFRDFRTPSGLSQRGRSSESTP